MRKNTFFIIMLLVGVAAFAAAPAFADYNQSDVMLDQADNTTFGMGDMTDQGDGPGNSVGLLADENPQYGPGTFRVPYEGKYGFPGCNATGTYAGPNSIALGPDGLPIGDAYNCVGSGDLDANLIIQDLFSAVTEGVITYVDGKPTPGSQGIAQYLDSVFAFNGVDGLVDPAGGDNLAAPQVGNVYINQTLDQDLADITAAGSQYGIWSRFHQAFTHTENADLPDSNGVSHYDHDGIDQTLIAFLSEESGPGVSAEPGIVVSYMAQWFQMGSNESCIDAEANLGVNLCDHTEFGGHGTINGGGSSFDPSAAVAAHDP